MSHYIDTKDQHKGCNEDIVLAYKCFGFVVVKFMDRCYLIGIVLGLEASQYSSIITIQDFYVNKVIKEIYETMPRSVTNRLRVCPPP